VHQEWRLLRQLLLQQIVKQRALALGVWEIADGKEAMLFLGEDKPSLVIWSDHVGLVGFAREYFQFLWDSSKKA